MYHSFYFNYISKTYLKKKGWCGLDQVDGDGGDEEK